MVDSVNKQVDESGEAIAEEIQAVQHLLKALRYRALRDGPHEMTHMGARALFFVGRNAGATRTEIVNHLRRDKAQVARVTAGLCEAGLLESQIDETDGRIRRLYLTPAGKEGLALVAHDRKFVAREAVAGLDETERRTLAELLVRVRENLERHAT